MADLRVTVRRSSPQLTEMTHLLMQWAAKTLLFSRLLKPDGTPLGETDSPALVQAKETIAVQWSNPEPDQMTALMRRVDIPESGKSDIDFTITAAE